MRKHELPLMIEPENETLHDAGQLAAECYFSPLQMLVYIHMKLGYQIRLTEAINKHIAQSPETGRNES
jgi:hypothetical protein